jgi:hypothetical protein
MKQIAMALAMLVAAQGVGATIGPRLGSGEAPRATDLLRAETLAEKAERRLRLPRATSRGWVKGGTGWGSDVRPAPPPSVTIRVAPPSKRRALE